MKQASSIDLCAGGIELRFEPHHLLARGWKAGGVEILQGISLTLRDCNWGTPSPDVKWEMIYQRKDSFALNFTARYFRGGKVYFLWQGELAGSSDGEVTFFTRGTAMEDVETNRAGFCVLYPAEVAGCSCKIRHVNGRKVNSRFPKMISPHQPFFDLRAITHRPIAGLETEVEMTGETFEMEDQRNWTDSSFKVYCRPLTKGWPFVIKRNETVEQSIRVKLSGSKARHRPVKRGKELVAQPAPNRVRLPNLGLGYSAQKQLPPKAIKSLKTLGLDHLRINLDVKEKDALVKWKNAAKAARELGCGLDVALFLEKEDARQLQRALPDSADAPFTRWFVFSRGTKTTNETVFKMARATLLEHGWKPAQIGGGTDVYFVDLNRKRPFFSDLSFIGYSINPQVHAFDNLSLIETLPMHKLTVTETRRLAMDRPVHVGPITFRPRFNPVATAKSAVPKPDPRQISRFGAVWTLGSIVALAQGKAAAATFYNTHGDGGVLDRELRPTILHRLFQALHPSTFDQTRVLESPESGMIFGLIFNQASGWRILVANASEATRTLRLCVPDASRATCRFLHSGKRVSLQFRKGTFALEMPGYSVAHLES